VTIVSFGKMMKVALKAAEELAAENINAEVIDLRTVRPIDYATVINSVKKTNRFGNCRRELATSCYRYRGCI